MMLSLLREEAGHCRGKQQCAVEPKAEMSELSTEAHLSAPQVSKSTLGGVNLRREPLPMAEPRGSADVQVPKGAKAFKLKD